MPTIQTLESGTEMVRGSKKANGNLLDGERHEADPFPKHLTAVEKRSTPSLTSGEKKRWQEALKVIDKGWEAFIEVGTALMEIRQSRLYREDYESWEAFCHDMMGISKTEANRQINDAKVVGDLKAPNGVTAGAGLQPPSTRSQVRVLAQLKKPEDRREAWRKASERAETTGSPVTAKIVTEVVKAIRGDADSAQTPSLPGQPDEKPSDRATAPAAAMDVIDRLRAARQSRDWTIVDEVIKHLEAQELQTTNPSHAQK